MVGIAKIRAALSTDGARDIPVVICYEGIFIRDHWRQLTDHPWWYRHAPDLERQLSWRRDAITRVGQDWFHLPRLVDSREERRSLSIEPRSGAVYLIDRRTRKEKTLIEPPIGGDHIVVNPTRPPSTAAEIDDAVPLLGIAGRFSEYVAESGRDDLAAALLKEYGAALFPVHIVSSPLECCFFELWGFEDAMINVARRRDLVEHACRRFLERSIDEARVAALLGAEGIFVEDSMTDMISPEAFAALNVPYARQLVSEIRNLGLKSIYYYCGDPTGKWDLLMSIGADAYSFEESKKGFTIDIEEVVDRVQGRHTLLGNLDAVGILQNGSEDQLRAEIARQIAAGRRNGSRFIMSIGSPVTPGTPVDRVRLYCDLARELGRR